MKTRLSVCLLLLAVLFACKKEKEEPAPDRRTLLTSRAWRLNEVLANNLPVTDPALLAMLGPFNQTTIRFNNDGTLTAPRPTAPLPAAPGSSAAPKTNSR
jgi:hypothetical protein